MRLSKQWINFLLFFLLAFGMAACQAAESCPECAEPTPCPEAAPTEPCPECALCQEPQIAEIPFQAQWSASGHADAAAEVFRQWDESGTVDPLCATCHSPTGYQDFLGVDGSAAGTIENVHLVSNGLTCMTCHNETAYSLTNVVFPSGAEAAEIGEAARCMVCHQGRSAGNRVESAIVEAGMGESRDIVSSNISFINIHYYAAAATLYGTEANGGYQYPDMFYEGQYRHSEGISTCTDCHEPHTLEVRIGLCAKCHTGIDSLDSLRTIRTSGSMVDYDGDGNIIEGIADEIVTLQEMLMSAIQAYAIEIAGAPVVFSQTTYPHFFIDLNANGTLDADEARTDNVYTSWTARLLEAAYNYQTSIQDIGAFAHNPKYIIQLLHDSIADLNSQLSTPIDLAHASRNDAGHFDGSSNAFHHWDEAGVIRAACARCHSINGLQTYIQYGVNIDTTVSNSFACSTCHEADDFPSLYAIKEVVFPSGESVTFGIDSPSNLCITCHQGTTSTDSVNLAIGGTGDNTVSESLTFINPHFLAAGATLYGSVARGAYEYDGRVYIGISPHLEMGNTCMTCHDPHALSLELEVCSICHAEVHDTTAIRITETDFDGDSDLTEGLAGEINTLEDALLVAIQNYAANTAGSPIGYDAHVYPFFFGDANENGLSDPDEGAYMSWTPRLLRAAYNYQWVQHDPGAYAHNGLYTIQILYDSLADLGADARGYARP